MRPPSSMNVGGRIRNMRFMDLRSSFLGLSCAVAMALPACTVPAVETQRTAPECDGGACEGPGLVDARVSELTPDASSPADAHLAANPDAQTDSPPDVTFVDANGLVDSGAPDASVDASAPDTSTVDALTDGTATDVTLGGDSGNVAANKDAALADASNPACARDLTAAWNEARATHYVYVSNPATSTTSFSRTFAKVTHNGTDFSLNDSSATIPSETCTLTGPTSADCVSVIELNVVPTPPRLVFSRNRRFVASVVNEVTVATRTGLDTSLRLVKVGNAQYAVNLTTTTTHAVSNASSTTLYDLSGTTAPKIFSTTGVALGISNDGKSLLTQKGKRLYLDDTASSVAVSVEQTTTGDPDVAATSAVLARDGSRVAFVSTATNLAARSKATGLYTWDRAAATTTEVPLAGAMGAPCTLVANASLDWVGCNGVAINTTSGKVLDSPAASSKVANPTVDFWFESSQDAGSLIEIDDGYAYFQTAGNFSCENGAYNPCSGSQSSVIAIDLASGTKQSISASTGAWTNNSSSFMYKCTAYQSGALRAFPGGLAHVTEHRTQANTAYCTPYDILKTTVGFAACPTTRIDVKAADIPTGTIPF